MIVIPMAGLSSRFARAGYTLPKFMLPVGDYTVFDLAIVGLLRPGHDEEVLFIYRGGPEIAEFIEARSRVIGLPRCHLVGLDRPTEGQAETVELGLDGAGVAPETEIDIFNIDTFYLRHSRPAVAGDGYLDVFVGSGDNWSFVRPGPNQTALETAEKNPISDLCCSGFYNFRRVGDFRNALAIERTIDRPAKELYVAPLYNHLIRAGLDIRYHVLQRADIVFSGVPSEYEAVIADPGLVAPLIPAVESRISGAQ